MMAYVAGFVPSATSSERPGSREAMMLVAEAVNINDSFRDWLESDDNTASHSWLYGQDFVRCVMCGAESVEDSIKPCPGFGCRTSDFFD